MSPKSSKPPAPAAPAPAKEPWQPRVEEEPEFNAFTNEHCPADDEPLPDELPDPGEDTAPLQGSRDLTDEDSVVIDGAGARPAAETDPDRLVPPSERRRH